MLGLNGFIVRGKKTFGQSISVTTAPFSLQCVSANISKAHSAGDAGGTDAVFLDTFASPLYAVHGPALSLSVRCLPLLALCTMFNLYGLRFIFSGCARQPPLE
eukprot:TRINITY_DN15081_c0_g1_i1.p1 TRINITY_DN15081_c0_g1~~TRINITY_DN15081_c0_g1_i1.p1  ORF type:complete len:103 (+),score=3.48 TRINITY_DN15081_c0_g1_i1:217-525(+)